MTFAPDHPPRGYALRFTLAASLLIHALLGFVLNSTWSSAPSGGPTGTVSVDFVEPVVHGNPEMAARSPGPARLEAALPAPARPHRPLSRPTPKDDSELGSRSQSLPRPTVTGSEAETPGGSSGGASGTASAGATAMSAFVARVTTLIDGRKTFPRAAVRRGWEGRVIVAITLDHRGHLSASGVEVKSPFALLDDAALAAVRDVGQYPPLPPGSGESLHLHVPIVFKISR